MNSSVGIDTLVDACEDAIRQACEAAQRGGDRLVKAVLCPDGSAYASESASRERGEDEYFRVVPHVLTVWEVPARMVRDEDDGGFDAADYAAAQRDELQLRIAEWIEAGNYTGE
jgi:hypothetical protein